MRTLEQEKERLILQEPMLVGIQPKPRTAMPILFAVVVTALGFSGAALATNEETAEWRAKIGTISPFQRIGSSYSTIMHQEWRQAKGREWQKSFDEFQKKIAGLPAGTLRPLAAYSYYYVAQSWVNLTEGKEMCYKLVGCFVGVYLLSAIPAARQVARRMFSHDPLSGRSFTLLTSQFGHAGLLHLAVNSFALLGFGEFAWSYLRSKQINEPGRLDEATSGYHFLAFHVAAGTFSALVSHLFATRVLLPRMVANLAKNVSASAAGAAPVTAVTPILPSIGASGAIWASLMLTSLAWPHTTVTLVFLPFIPISIGTGVLGFIALDIVGLIRGWRFFDHAAHLGGAAFGAMYYYYGPPFWDAWRREMLEVMPPTAKE